MNRWVKKLSAVALTAGMLMSNISYMPMTSSVVNAVESEVEEEIHIWDGTSDVSWYDDEETEFHISTPEQLAGLSKIANTGKTMEGKTFILDNDIYLNDVSAYDEWGTTPPENKWTPLGNFSGTLLGENHSIIDLYGSSGMFGNVTNGYISEVNLVDIYISYSFGYSTTNNVSITNSRSMTTFLGGLVEHANKSSIIKCSVQGRIGSYASINAKLSSYDIKLKYEAYIGGVVGQSDSDKIIDCFSNVKIVHNSNCKAYYFNGNKNVSLGVSQFEYVGGICGYSNSSVINCTNNGSIETGFSYTGGICGQSNKVIKNCKNIGEINSNRDNGGICGNNGGIILNCYNMSEIKENGNGICGSNSDGIIRNVYNTGKIVDGYAIASGGSITNAYYLSGTALKGTNSSNDTTIAKSEANMKKESFADSLGEAFYYVEGEFPKLAFEVGRTISNFDKTSLAFKEFGETQTLSLDTTYLGEPEWVSSDTSVATVDSDGVVTAVGNGTAMIYALCSDSKAACSVTVGYDYYLSDNELTLKKGRVHNLSVLSASTGKEVTDIDVEWSSSDDSIVSVDSEGKIITNAVGTAAITAKVADLELSCIVSVYEYQVPAVIVPDDENAPKLSETDFTISTIDSKLLSVENYADSITWVSANTSIAKVSKNGLVKGVSEGNTMIYALLSDGRCLKANAVVTKSEYTMGDVNLDGEFNVTDAVLLQKWLLVVPNVELKCWENADFYADGKLDVFDLCMMKNALITK